MADGGCPQRLLVAPSEKFDGRFARGAHDMYAAVIDCKVVAEATVLHAAHRCSFVAIPSPKASIARRLATQIAGSFGARPGKVSR